MIKALEKLRRGERILPPPGGIDCDDDNDYGYMFYNEKHWKSNISFPPGGEGSSHPQEGSSSLLGVGGSLPPMVPIGSWEELWFPRVINRCSPTPPPALHLLHSAHHIDSIYNDSRQLECLQQPCVIAVCQNVKLHIKSKSSSVKFHILI